MQSNMKTYDVIMTPSDEGLWVLKSEAEKIIRHSKYKRCMAMAKWCELDIEQWIEGSFRWQRRKKWHNRWCKLADEFKEAK